MAILTPVNITHNNPELPTVYFSDVKGNVWTTGSYNEQYGIPEGKRELGMIVYFSSSQDFKYYKGGTTLDGDWSTSTNWEVLGGNSVNTGSLLLTASVASNTITFTKGNGDTFPITVETGSGVLAAANFTASFNNQSTWTINHNLDYKYVLVQIFDSNDNQIIPEEITLVDSNTAQATFNSGVSGKAVVTVGGTTLNATLPTGSNNEIQYNNGGAFGASSIFQFDGTTVIIYDPTETRYAFLTETSLFNTSNVTQKTLLDDNYVEEFTTTTTGVQFTGNILAGKIFDVTNVTPYDIAFLSGSDNAWYPVTGNSASLDSRLLGVILSEGDILTEGYITVAAVASSATDAPLIHGTLEPGSPVYISVGTPNTQPYLSTTRPNSAGKIVRIVGHLIYQNINIDDDYWLMYFRPDHTWVEIAP